MADDLGIAVAAGITKKSSAVHWLLSLVKGIVHNFFLLYNLILWDMMGCGITPSCTASPNPWGQNF